MNTEELFFFTSISLTENKFCGMVVCKKINTDLVYKFDAIVEYFLWALSQEQIRFKPSTVTYFSR